MNHFLSISWQTEKNNVNRTRTKATRTWFELTVMNKTRGLNFLPLVSDRGKDGQRIFHNKVDAIKKASELTFYSTSCKRLFQLVTFRFIVRI